MDSANSGTATETKDYTGEIFRVVAGGILQSRSVNLSKIAGKIPGEAKLLSTARRLGRFLNNSAIRVRIWYEPIARLWLVTLYRHLGEILLVVDGTKIGSRHQLLIVCLTYCKRAIPIAWTWVPPVSGHNCTRMQLALLCYVRSLIPAGAAVFLVGDCDFGAVGVLRQLKRWHWFYVLRQKSDTCLWFNEEQSWQPFGSFIQKPEQSFWLGSGYIDRNHILLVNLLIHWKRGEKEPWCLATNLPGKHVALRFFALRPWIEEMFGYVKKHGFDLERTKLCHFQRFSPLTLAVAILYVGLVSIGTQTIRSGDRHLLDRNDRRDLSIIQIGFRFIERRLTNALPINIPLCSYR